MDQEQNLMEGDLLSLNKNQLKEAFKDLKRVDEINKEFISKTFIELFQSFNNKGDSSKFKNNMNDFLDCLFKLMKLNTRINELEKIIRFSEKEGNQLDNLDEGQEANAQEMDVNNEGNINSNGDNNINSKKINLINFLFSYEFK